MVSIYMCRKTNTDVILDFQAQRENREGRSRG